MAKHYSQFSREELEAKLDIPCQDAGLSATIAGILDSNGIHNLGMLLARTKKQLLTINGVSQRTIDRIYEVLANHGFY